MNLNIYMVKNKVIHLFAELIQQFFKIKTTH